MSDHQEEKALELVRQGWDHLHRERPIAARFCWRLAQRIAPGDPAATQALQALRTSPELPEAARKEWRVRPPATDDRQARWGRRIQDGFHDLDRLEWAEEAFRDLIAEDPDDHEARFNRALCLAWTGQNAQAIRELRALVARSVRTHPDLAEDAWLLAEVLRAGSGAEAEADDLSHAWVFPIEPGEPTTPPVAILRSIALGPDASRTSARVFEWLDRDLPDPSADIQADDLPQVLATGIESPGRLRLSSPDPASLEEAADRLGPIREQGERTATPLPLHLLDAGLWTFRLPSGLDLDTRRRLSREAVEHRLESVWIHWPRHGLDGLSPRDAARKAAAGDPEARVMLSAVVRSREELGQRPASAELYGGYPFARLRRRLGLPIDPNEPAPEPTDLSCASRDELSAIDPARLDDPSLAEAARSAAGLRDDPITERLTEALLDRGPAAIAPAWAILPSLIAAGLRQAIAGDDESAARQWLDRAEAVDPDRSTTYRTWRTEWLASQDDPESN